MKKILKRTFTVLAVLIVAIVAAIASLTYEGKPAESVIATDAAGNTYYVYEDKKNNTTYAVVTDEEGNRYAAEFDGNTVGSTVEKINDKVAIEDVPTNYTGAHTEITANVEDYTGAPVTSAPTTTLPAPTQPGNPQVPSTTAPAPTEPKTKAYRINKYQQIFAGGTYLMQFTDPEISDLPVTMAIKNGNMYIDTTMEIDAGSPPMNVKMIYKNDTKTMYMVMDSIKKYFKLPEDLMGEDMDMEQMLSEFNITELKDVTATEVELGGQKLILESYKDSSGTTFNYYFNGEDMVRRDTINKDGTTNSMFISKFTTDVPDSTFEIPEGYGYFNLSWLGAMM